MNWIQTISKLSSNRSENRVKKKKKCKKTKKKSKKQDKLLEFIQHTSFGFQMSALVPSVQNMKALKTFKVVVRELIHLQR